MAKLIFWVCIFLVGFKLYDIYDKKVGIASVSWSDGSDSKSIFKLNSTKEVPTKNQVRMPKKSQKKSPRFTCDGRQYCSQMRSRAEAEYFTRYCPDTKMDGDHDGIPCENHSAW